MKHSITVGVDVFDAKRMERAIEQDNPVYLSEVFTPGELAAARESGNYVRFLASRFALKEAAFKALRTEWEQDMAWDQIEISSTAFEAPEVSFHGRMSEAAENASGVCASLSTDGDIIFAVVLMETQSR